MLSCREVTYQVSGPGLEELGWWGRLKVRLHLLFCRPCRSYALEIRDLGTVVREIQQERIDNEDVRVLEAKILAAIDRDPQ